MSLKDDVLEAAEDGGEVDVRKRIVQGHGVKDEYVEELIWAYLEWLEDEDSIVDRTVNYKLDSEKGLEYPAYKSFCNWMNLFVYDYWYTLLEGLADDVIKDIFVEMYHRDDEFRERLHEQTVAINERNKAVGRLSGYVDEQGEEEEDTDKDIMRYGKINEAGIVDEDNQVNISKLRGTALKFASEVEEITGTEEELNRDDLRAAYNRWMLDRLGEDWSRFITEKLDPGDLMEIVLYMYKHNDDFKSLVQQKYRYDETELEGNGGKKSEWKKKNERQDITNYDGRRVGGDSEESGRDQEGHKEPDDNEPTDGDTEPIVVSGSDIIHGDCVEVVKRMEGTIDAIITDPPYGMDYDSRGDEHEVIEGDDDLGKALELTEEVLKKARMNLRSGSPIIVFAGKSNLCGVMSILKKWYTFEDINVWHKGYVGTSQISGKPMKWRPMHEYAVLARYKKPRHENEARHDGNVWEFQRKSGSNMDHPTEKPVKLLKYIIESLTQEGDVVFDPFAGSGSTLVAANQLDRGYFGVELDDKYYEHIQSRLSQNTLSAWSE